MDSPNLGLNLTFYVLGFFFNLFNGIAKYGVAESELKFDFNIDMLMWNFLLCCGN